MYENKTYENILAAMLARVPTELDRSEGSVIWLAHAPAAIELAQAYVVAENIYTELDGNTASRENLLKMAMDTKGMTPKAATAAVWYITAVPSDIDLLGTRFSCGTMMLAVTGATEDGEWIAECETAGAAGNSLTGALLPVEYINGLESVSLTELAIAGADEEDTETFRKRWKQSFKTRVVGGNKAFYKEQIKAIDGVGGVKVYRAQNADGETVGGHVRCVITAADYTPPSEELVAAVQQIIDPTLDGEGDGVALFGHTVHILGAGEHTVNISAVFTFEDGISFADKKPQIEDAVNEYLYSVRVSFEDSEYLTVRVSKIESAILNVAGVVDIADTLLNGNTSNLILTSAQLPMLGNITEV